MKRLICLILMTCFISLVSYANKGAPVENGVSVENVVNFSAFMPEADYVVMQQTSYFENEIILLSAIEHQFLPEAASIEYQPGSAIMKNSNSVSIILSVEVVRRSGRLNNGVSNIYNLSLNSFTLTNKDYSLFGYSMKNWQMTYSFK